MELIRRVFGNTMLDTFLQNSSRDPFEGFSSSLLDEAFSWLDKDVSAAANTRVDRVETPEAFLPNSSRDPFEGFSSSLLDEAFSWLHKDVSAVANTRVDWVETPEAHVFKADLPGMKKEEIKIQVEEDGILSISGERQKEKVDEKDLSRQEERSYGKFYRQFKLLSNGKLGNVSAKVENGVLTVTVPKEVESQNGVCNVEIQG